MANALARIVEYPNRPVFDKDPQPALALRIRNPAGLRWQIADGVLSLVTGDNLEFDGIVEWNGDYDFGLTTRQYPLAGKTIAQLADALAEDGHEVVFESPELGGRSALVLLAGANDQDASNGDHLRAYTSLFWALYDSYAVELDEAEYQVRQALRQMVMTQAEGEWLDVWGGLYGVPRLPGETDAELQQRLPEEVFRLRLNGLAIEQAIKVLTGETVTIDEPWRRMHILDESALSGIDHLQDGQYYTYHVIQPVGIEGTDWTGVMDVIRRNKAAGVEIYASKVATPPRHITVQPPVEYRIERGRLDTRGSAIWSTNDQILGVMRLSDNEITLNHPCNRHDWWVKGTGPVVLYEGLHRYDGEASYGDPLDAIHVGLQTHQQLTLYRSIAMASIPLSDGDPLGDENAILSRGAERVEFDPEPIPSDLMYLSGYDAETVVERVELITIVENVAGVESVFTASGEVQLADGRAYASDPAYQNDRVWSGAWDTDTWESAWRQVGMAISVEVGTLDFNYDGQFEHDGRYQYIGYRGY